MRALEAVKHIEQLLHEVGRCILSSVAVVFGRDRHHIVGAEKRLGRNGLVFAYGGARLGPVQF